MWKRLLFLVLAARCAWADPLADEMRGLSDVIFSGNGTVEMVEWENFTFQVTPDIEPVDIAALFRDNKVPQEQREMAETLFLKAQVVANLERGGKTMTQFLESKGFTMSIYEHEFNPALMYSKVGEPNRRFDFVRREGKLKLARVSLQQPSQNGFLRYQPVVVQDVLVHAAKREAAGQAVGGQQAVEGVTRPGQLQGGQNQRMRGNIIQEESRILAEER